MAYLVVAYPKIDQHDFEEIQEYRKANDPRYLSVIDPHFTLVFAINDIDKTDFLGEVTRQLVGVRPFEFELKAATIT